MNLAEALQYLHDLEVSDSSENDLEIEHQDITKIFIQPPLDSNEITVTLILVTKRTQVLIILAETTPCASITCGKRCKER